MRNEDLFVWKMSALAWGAVAVLGLIAWLMLVNPASGHDAPSGWEYPNICCHNLDCAPVEWAGEDKKTGEAIANTKLHAGISMVPDKYQIKMTSPDQQYHICATPDSGLTAAGRTYYCIFRPAGM